MKNLMLLLKDWRLEFIDMHAEGFLKKINYYLDLWWLSGWNKLTMRSTISCLEAGDRLSIEKINQWILMNGLNLQTGMQFVTYKSFLTSQTLLEHLFIMPNNGKNGIWQPHLKKNHFLENGIKNVTVWGSLLLRKLSEEIESSLLLLTLLLIKMEMKTLFILQTSPYKVFITIQIRTHLLYSSCHLVLTHIHNLTPLRNLKRLILCQFP